MSINQHLMYLKSGSDYMFSAKFRSQMSDSCDFFTSGQDSVNI